MLASTGQKRLDLAAPGPAHAAASYLPETGAFVGGVLLGVALMAALAFLFEML